MLAVGIPSYNEADNIVQLITAIDNAALELDIDIVFINADNNSPDLTAQLFQNSNTYAEKVSIITHQRGKGVNIKAILEYVSKRDDITYCMFIDADITSFDLEWLTKHYKSYTEGADYVIPNYARYMQEGNTTNHFVYPLLSYLTNGIAPHQGIAGDFGISKKFATYLSNISWPTSSLGYGVDIFMTMHALFNTVRVEEITLNHKIHKPSFDKMVSMFQQVAESYYMTRNILKLDTVSEFTRVDASELQLLRGDQITAEKIQQRRRQAIELLTRNDDAGLHVIKIITKPTMDLETWVNILAEHEQRRHEYTPRELAASLTPYYLLRVATYLQNIHSTTDAIDEIEQTAILLADKLESPA